MIIGQVDPNPDAVEFGLPPCDGKSERGIEEHVEVEAIARIFPEVIGIHYYMTPMACSMPALNWFRLPDCNGIPAKAPKTLAARPPAPVALDNNRFSLNGVSRNRP